MNAVDRTILLNGLYNKASMEFAANTDNYGAKARAITLYAIITGKAISEADKVVITGRDLYGMEFYRSTFDLKNENEIFLMMENLERIGSFKTTETLYINDEKMFLKKGKPNNTFSVEIG